MLIGRILLHDPLASKQASHNGVSLRKASSCHPSDDSPRCRHSTHPCWEALVTGNKYIEAAYWRISVTSVISVLGVRPVGVWASSRKPSYALTRISLSVWSQLVILQQANEICSDNLVLSYQWSQALQIAPLIILEQKCRNTIIFCSITLLKNSFYS